MGIKRWLIRELYIGDPMDEKMRNCFHFCSSLVLLLSLSPKSYLELKKTYGFICMVSILINGTGAVNQSTCQSSHSTCTIAKPNAPGIGVI